MNRTKKEKAEEKRNQESRSEAATEMPGVQSAEHCSKGSFVTATCAKHSGTYLPALESLTQKNY